MKKSVVLALLAVFGCLAFALSGDSGGLTGKVIGIWHYQYTNLLLGGTEEHFLEIAETSIVHDTARDKDTFDTALTEKDGMVVARYAGTEREAFVIRVIDQDTIETSFRMYGRQRLKRVTAEARAEGLEKNKPKEWEVRGDDLLLNHGKSFATVLPDGSLETIGPGPKTGRYDEIIGHVTDFIPDWKPTRKVYEITPNGNGLNKNDKTWGEIKKDGSVVSVFKGPKTGQYNEPLGHVTDFIPDWKPE